MEPASPSLELPVLPIRNAVLYPSVSMPLVVGRGRSLKAVDQAEAAENLLIIVAQRNLTTGDPEPGDLYTVGNLCRLESVNSSEAGSRQIVVTSLARYRIIEYKTHPDEGYLSGRGEAMADARGEDPIRTEALFYNLKELAREVLELLPGATEHLARLIERVDDPAYLTNICAAYLNLSVEQKQALLEEVNLDRRIELLLDHMRKERELLSVQRDIRDKMNERLNKAQREAILREQLRTIRTELGEEAAEESTEDIETKIKEAHLPEEAERQAKEELNRLKSLPSSSAEYHVVRTYLEWLAALPWDKRTQSRIDVARSRTILEEDHYGLQEVKKRILQFLAVAKLKNNLSGPILCLVGPPGVGKTSLGQSIARALERKFVRTSLGGVRDEAEIRGHRRTYVGAMPGRIIQSIKRAGVKNPVMMLDEIDKLRSDFHGDPSAAMLEVLDPEQNRTFVDHYLDIAFDLSEVFFICTANVTDTIPPALRDRMEIIEVSGYTTEEKTHIACRYLLPKQIREHGLKPEWVEIEDGTLDRIILRHTREAGVRELQRKIAALLRSVAEEIVERQSKPTEVSPQAVAQPIRIAPDDLPRYLGPDRFFPEAVERVHRPGVAVGMAWTPHGGDLLYIEATSLPGGRGNITLTGQLGDVMKESALIAVSFARSAVVELLRRNFDFGNHDIHIHVPSGAIPKDGPSAGVTILSAIVSLLIDRPVAEGLAMTGEITLRGAVLPVGGIKEKVLAAHRGLIRKVVLPRRNEQDLNDVPENVRKEMTFAFVDSVDQVLAEAFPGIHIGALPLRVA